MEGPIIVTRAVAADAGNSSVELLALCSKAEPRGSTKRGACVSVAVVSATAARWLLCS